MLVSNMTQVSFVTIVSYLMMNRPIIRVGCSDEWSQGAISAAHAEAFAARDCAQKALRVAVGSREVHSVPDAASASVTRWRSRWKQTPRSHPVLLIPTCWCLSALGAWERENAVFGGYVQGETPRRFGKCPLVGDALCIWPG